MWISVGAESAKEKEGEGKTSEEDEKGGVGICHPGTSAVAAAEWKQRKD